MDINYETKKYPEIKGLAVCFSRSISSLLLQYQFKGASYFRRKLCPSLIPQSDGPVICPTIYGFKLLVDAHLDQIIGRHIYYFGEYEAGTMYVMKKTLKPGDTFLDVGASIGLMTCLASKLVGKTGRVLAVEPSPWAYSMLDYNVKLNEFNNITTFEIALGSKAQQLLIYDGRKGNPGTASLMPLSSGQSGRAVKVEAIDKLLEAERITVPTVIKIDAEGYELEVLKGAKGLLNSPNAPILIIEYSNLHPQYGGCVLDIYKFIQTINSYYIYKLEKSKSNPSRLVQITDVKQLPQHDNIFCFPEVRMRELKPEVRLEA